MIVFTEQNRKHREALHEKQHPSNYCPHHVNFMYKCPLCVAETQDVVLAQQKEIKHENRSGSIFRRVWRHARAISPFTTRTKS